MCVVCACVMQEVQCLTVSLSVLLLVYIQSAFGSCEVTMIREVGVVSLIAVFMCIRVCLFVSMCQT